MSNPISPDRRRRRIYRAPTAQIRALALIYCGELHQALAEIENIVKEMP